MAKHTLDYTGAELDAILASVGDKYGYMRISSTVNEQNFYSLEAFPSKEDADEYDSDPEGYRGRVSIITIPISTVQGDSYASLLATSIPTSAVIVSTKESLMIPLNFRGVKISQIGSENAGVTGSLTIQRRITGGEWSTALTMENVLTSYNYTDTDTYQEVDIAPALINSLQEIRVRASFQYEDIDGSVKTAYSAWVMVGKSVTKTTLRLDLSTDYSQPIALYDANGNRNNFIINYIPRGEVSKRLHVKVRGSYGTYTTMRDTPENGSVIPACNINVSQNDSYGLATHGIKYVEAYLEAEDGMGNTITSNVLRNQFMVASDASNTQPYLLLQNVAEDAVNYMQTDVCEYAIYSPSTDKVKIALLMTGYASDYETEQVDEYFRLEQEVEPKTQQKLTATIEIETESVEDSYAYLRVRRLTETADTDFIKESTGDTSSYTITVDNRNAFTPVAGSTFLLNPKVRSNNEENPARIINSRNNNAEVEATFEGFGFITDGWVDSGTQRVLRVPAGGKLTIKRDMWKAFRNNPDTQLNFEIDFSVHNITNTTDPIIDIAEDTATGFKGLRMNATDGWLKSKSYNVSDDCLFSWQEDKRTHVFVNIENIVQPQGPDVTYNGDYNAIPDPTDNSKLISRISVARIFIDGDLAREIPFDVRDNTEWSENGCDIIIGNEGCDIDIYSFRAYETENRNITPRTILMRNYIATLASSAEKQNVYQRNNITDGSGRISLEAAKALGLNCMVWHGVLPSKINDGEYKGWYEYFRYDEQRQLLKEYSGTNCKSSGTNNAITEADSPLIGKGQGSTAKTYWDWNIQDDNSKVKTTIRVAVGDFHESITLSEPYSKDGAMYVDIYGGNLGKNFPVELKAKAYPYDNGYVTVPDGWIDGNGKYRGMGYMVAQDTALAQKKVIKVNYASSMQSHLLGACKTYDLLHRAVVGNTPLQDRVPTAVSAKHTEPFLLFHEVNGNVYYKGLGNYGAAKMDKVAWGYAKSLHPNFALIEGSDNNMTLTDFRVPFDKNTAVYNCKEEYWEYNDNGCFDFDGGATVDYTGEEDSILKQQSEGWKFKNADAESEAPSANIRDRWAFVCNYIYLHGTNIKFFNGTYSNFIAHFNAASDTDKADYLASKMWFATDDGDYKAYNLYRYDALTKTWINAGLLGGDGTYRAIDLRTNSMTKMAYEANKGNFDLMNKAFKAAITEHMHATIKYVINEDSLIFNYCYVLSFLAGTDNSSKNTYYKIMPIEKAFVVDNAFNTWYKDMFGATEDFNFSFVYQVYLDGDDMDSILRTNNNSHQTKPYYIERRFPYDDDKPTECLYEGMRNQLFNYVEEYALLYPNTLPNMLNRILTKASDLVSDTDTLYGLTANKKSAWGFLHKYFFNTQYYFPQICYNEQARIRYEFPHMIGYISSGSGARNIQPISQSLGSQLQNELQYMKQRLVYMASYARWSALAGSSGVLGISDNTPSLSITGNGIQYKFVLKSYQYIYPTFNSGQSKRNIDVRLKPNTPFEYILDTGGETGDAGIGLYGIDYYTSVGNMGDFAATNQTLTVQGKRLREFIAEPTSGAPFAPKAIRVTATQLDTFSLKGCVGIEGSLDLSVLTRVQTIDLTGTKLYEVGIPYSANLTSIKLGDSIQRFVLNNTPNLLSVTFGAVDKMDTVIIGENVGTFDTKAFISALYFINAQLKQLSLEGVEWTIPIAFMMWLTAIENATIKGTITIEEPTTSTAVTFEYKNLINQKWGDVDHADSDEHRGLLLSYKQQSVGAATIMGNYYNEQTEHPFTLAPNSKKDNKFTKILWSAVADGLALSEFSIDPVTGVLTTGELSKVVTNVVVSANVYYGEGEPIKVFSKNIKVYDRPAQVGDLVYFDGTYGDAEDYDAEKTVVGICFYVAPRHQNGEIVEELFNPNDKQSRLMVDIKNHEIVDSNYKAYSYFAYFDKSILYTLNEGGGKAYFTSGPFNETTFYSVPSALATSGGYAATNKSTYLSSDNELALLDCGIVPVRATTPNGEGGAFEETKEFVANRTLTKEMADLAGDGYNEGDIVNRGYALMLHYMVHRNTILKNGIPEIGLDSRYDFFAIPTATGDRTESKHLADIFTGLNNWATENEIGDYNSRFYAIMMPMFSAAYAYEPTVKSNEKLSDKFKAHNWFAPPMALLIRILAYQLNWITNASFTKAKDLGLFIPLESTGAAYLSPAAKGFYIITGITATTISGQSGYPTAHSQRARFICSF